MGGAGAADTAHAVAIDKDDWVLVGGRTNSTAFPTLNPVQKAFGGIDDGFVMKFDASGALEYSTFLGGTGTDIIRGVAIDITGAVTAVGYTNSGTFPLVDAEQSSFQGNYDAFVTKLEVDGSKILYSTYLGGSDFDQANAAAGAAGGAVYVAGHTRSGDFYLQQALQQVLGELPGWFGYSAFFAKYTLPVGTVKPPPAAPTNLAVTYFAGGGAVLTWDDNATDETEIRLERLPEGYTYALLASMQPDSETYTDFLLFGGKTYTYRVRAIKGNARSAWSNEVSIETAPDPTPPPPPSPPTLLTCFPVEGGGAVDVNWKDNSPDELGFTLQRAEGGLPYERLAFEKANTTRRLDDTAHPGWKYVYRIQSFGFSGPSQFTAPATTTPPATLAFALTKPCTLVNSATQGKSTVKVTGKYGPIGTETAPVIDPVAGGISIQIGFDKSAVFVTIPPNEPIKVKPNDPGWKLVKSKKQKGKPQVVTKATWTTPKGALQKSTVVVNLKTSTVTVTLKNRDFAPESDGPITVALASDLNGGAHTAEWKGVTKKGTTTFTFKPPR
jgi:hypothetical protein